jgi:hypothetical protein
MKYRLCGWAIAGFLVACFWAWYLFPTGVTTNPSILDIARLTCAIVFVDFGVRFYWVLLGNAITYALAGLLIEAMRSHRAPAQA